MVGALAAIKALVHRGDEGNVRRWLSRPSPLSVVVNMAPTPREANVAHDRLARACRRLLGINLTACAYHQIGRETWLTDNTLRTAEKPSSFARLLADTLAHSMDPRSDVKMEKPQQV